jgi:uncharacterized protein YebE (UPF0316 family)
MGIFQASSEIFTWVVLPVLIFISRIFDVSISTLRIIFLSRRKKLLAPVLGFFEVLIWLVAITQIMQHLDNVFCYLAYGLGFAAGTLVGMTIEEKLAIGTQVIRIFLTKDDTQLKEQLIAANFGLTVVDAMGATGQVKIVYTIVRRKDVRKVIEIINRCNAKAFYSIEDAITTNEGVFPHSNRLLSRKYRQKPYK